MQLCIDIALLAAVPLEVEGLTAGLAVSADGTIGGERFAIGTLHDQTILVGTLGFGKVNAAATVAALAERFRLRQVWHVGCGGAYSGGPLSIGDVLITTEFHCGDEGILEAGEESQQSSIGFPLVTAGGISYFNVFPVDQKLLNWVHAMAPPGHYQMRPFPQPADKSHDTLQVQPMEPLDGGRDAGVVRGSFSGFPWSKLDGKPGKR